MPSRRWKPPLRVWFCDNLALLDSNSCSEVGAVGSYRGGLAVSARVGENGYLPEGSVLPFFYRKTNLPKTKRIFRSNTGDLQRSSISETCWKVHISEPRQETGNFVPFLIVFFSVGFRSSGLWSAMGGYRHGTRCKGGTQRSLWLQSQFLPRQFGSIQSHSQEKEVGKRQQMNERRFLDHNLPTLGTAVT